MMGVMRVVELLLVHADDDIYLLLLDVDNVGSLRAVSNGDHGSASEVFDCRNKVADTLRQGSVDLALGGGDGAVLPALDHLDDRVALVQNRLGGEGITGLDDVA
eukprot:TRINITY_DN15683_c0_g1_i11.p2 TRINITY_DN15683_c0_g1~~TRINITY_DN15683_c0_g1_i11.p2  ORF type:complete len:104 (+),score=16.91 TRINITY_DN15683_c0_g1_i11:310-621(+)